MQPLSPESIEGYRRDGILILRGVFSAAEIKAVSDEAAALLTRTELMDERNLRVRWDRHYETGEPLFDFFDPFVDLSTRCLDIARDVRLTSVLETLLGGRVHLFKDRLIYKPGGTAGFPLHQDYLSWPGFPESFTTVAVAIDRASTDNGCIEVFPGIHAKGCLSEQDGDFHILPDEAVASTSPLELDLQPGDVAIYGCFMPHRSSANRTQSSRRHLLLGYNADADGGDQRAAYYKDLHHRLRGLYSTPGTEDFYFR